MRSPSRQVWNVSDRQSLARSGHPYLDLRPRQIERDGYRAGQRAGANNNGRTECKAPIEALLDSPRGDAAFMER